MAYVCLILGSGLYGLEPLIADVRAGQMASFDQFIAGVDDRITELPEYYLTRTEQLLLDQRAVEIARLARVAELVELGAGSAR